MELTVRASSEIWNTQAIVRGINRSAAKENFEMAEVEGVLVAGTILESGSYLVVVQTRNKANMTVLIQHLVIAPDVLRALEAAGV